MAKLRRMVLVEPQPDGTAVAYMTVAGNLPRLVLSADAQRTAVRISEASHEILGVDLLPWEVERAAVVVEIMRTTRPWQEARYPANALKRIEKAVVALASELPGFLGFLRDASQDSLPAYDLLKEQIQIFEGLHTAALRAHEITKLRPPRRREATRYWHGDAVWVAGFITMVGGRVGMPMTFNHAGDEVRFLIRVLESAIINVEADAVVKFFQRRPEPVPSAAFVVNIEGQ
jgi:hypothetical protein